MRFIVWCSHLKFKIFQFENGIKNYTYLRLIIYLNPLKKQMIGILCYIDTRSLISLNDMNFK